jgi:flagellar hook-associated protein 3 FlgL
MRVTESVLANTTQTNLQRMQQRLLDLQQQVSTGVKVSKPGDDPLTAQQILDLQDQLGSGDQYVKNISTGNAFLTTEESALGSMGDSLTRLKEIALQMSNGTYSADQRTNAMAEVQQLKEQMISLGNTKLGDRYVFSGSKTDTQPFDTSGAYNGNDSDVSINIDASNSVVINYSGGKLLRGTGGGTDVLGTIDNLINALGSNDVSGVQSTVSDLDKSMNQVLSARTDIGARMNRLEATNNFLSNTQVYLQKTISDKQDIDIAKAISDLTQQQTAYQAALMSTAKISSMSLLDYLT